MTVNRTMFAFFAAAAFLPLAGQSATAHDVTVRSPDGRMRAEVNTADGMLRYRIVVDGKQVLAPSMIGIETDDTELGRDVTLGPAMLRKVDEHYRFFGARAEAIDRARGNTWTHELAQAIAFTSPFLCYGGHPQSYLENPVRDVLTAIPPVWDETRILAGSEPGKVIAEARRSGRQWFIAVINGGEATTLDLPLDFLGAGVWESTQLSDAKDQSDAWNRENTNVTLNDHIHLEIAARGGFIGWFRQ